MKCNMTLALSIIYFFSHQLPVRQILSFATVTCVSTTRWCATESRTVSTLGMKTTAKVSHAFFQYPLNVQYIVALCFSPNENQYLGRSIVLMFVPFTLDS